MCWSLIDVHGYTVWDIVFYSPCYNRTCLCCVGNLHTSSVTAIPWQNDCVEYQCVRFIDLPFMKCPKATYLADHHEGLQNCYIMMTIILFMGVFKSVSDDNLETAVAKESGDWYCSICQFIYHYTPIYVYIYNIYICIRLFFWGGSF